MPTIQKPSIWSPAYDLDEPREEAAVETVCETPASLAGFYLENAKKIWPNGTTFYCERCRRVEGASVRDIARFLAGGWPLCHGERMRIGDPAARETAPT